MADRKTVIRGLERCKVGEFEACTHCPYDGHGCESALIGDAIILLKGQEASVVVWQGESGDQWYACEACDRPINPGDKFCRECGRKLLWEPPKEEDDAAD